MRECDWCGDVIGVYEPAVFVAGEAHETSYAAEPELGAAATERYHRNCFATRNGQPAAAALRTAHPSAP